MGNRTLERLFAQRTEQEQFISQLLEQVDSEDRDLVEAEERNITAARERIEALDRQIEPIEAYEASLAAHRAQRPLPDREDRGAGGGERRLGIRPREVSYASPGHFMVDYVRSIEYPSQQMQGVYDADAAQRVGAALQSRAAGDVAPGLHQTTADTPGIMPETIQGEILNDLDQSRPLIESVGAKDLAGIPGKKFSRPIVTGDPNQGGDGTQAEEKAEGSKGEVTIGGVDFDKATFLRWMNISRQEIDWTSPSVWNTLIFEMIGVYAEDTEGFASRRLDAGVAQVTPVTADTYEGWIRALYAARGQIVTANGTKRARVKRLPNTLYVSHDMDESIGALIDIHLAGNYNPIGQSSLDKFGGELMRTARVMVPDLPDGTVIYGRKQGFEFYEQRIGLLQAVEPEVLGVKVSYGGYTAGGVLDGTLFAKLVLAGTGGAAPVISALDPNTGAADDTVVITGTGFSGVTAVAFGGNAATSFDVESDTEIVAVVPAGTGAVQVTVTDPAGTSAGATFTYA